MRVFAKTGIVLACTAFPDWGFWGLTAYFVIQGLHLFGRYAVYEFVRGNT